MINGIENLDFFIKDLDKFNNNNIEKICKKSLERINIVGEKKLSSEIQSIENEEINMNKIPTVIAEPVINNSTRIKTVGETAYFVEFGVGTEGQTSNYDNSIISKILDVPKTGIWEYNYSSKHKFVSSNSGKITWKVPEKIQFGTRYINEGGYTHGFPAGMQVLKTYNYIYKRIDKIVKDVIEENID